MKIGVALNIQAEDGKRDADIVGEHLALGDLAEPLGFNSLFMLEHHFTDYLISPSPLQTLAYFAGRTKELILGTAVVVLPWHHPLLIAEQIAMIDVVSQGRCVFAFGRGRSHLEYESLGIDMSESLSRFAEASEIIINSLSQRNFEHSGKHYRFPSLSVRPRPISSPEQRFYAAVSSSASIKVATTLGFGLLVATTNPWNKMATDVAFYQSATACAGFMPKAPIVLTSVSVAKSRSEAECRAIEFFQRDAELASEHYGSADDVSESKNLEKQELERNNENSSISTYMQQQVIGTPDDCIQKIIELTNLTGTDHLVIEFSFGGMPHEVARKNMFLFAKEVLPIIKKLVVR